jgi:hypothetical protein
MTMPTLAQLLVPVGPEVIFEQELSIGSALGLPVTAWQAGGAGREILYINAQICSNFSYVMAEGPVAGGFLTYAKGGWLTLCAFETFDTTRIESSSATGKIRLNNDGVAPFVFGVGEVRVLNETAQKTYTNSTAGAVPAGGTLATTEFTADEPGTASNLTSGDTLSLVATVPGVTPEWLENLIGQDEETDPALVIRAREANAKASPNGPADAYQYYAKSSVRPDGSAIGVTRTNTVEGNGTVTLYLADADGALTSQDRGYVFDNVNMNVVPTGFTLVIPDPSCVEVPIDLEPTIVPNPDASASHAETEDLMLTAVADYLSSIAIGGAKANSFQGVYHDTLITVMRNAAGSDVLSITLPVPAGNVALTGGQAPVLGDFTPTWTA